ncbi:hypothetical protein DFP72DRAFT_1051647 [Ephemerocybe angulata]|uniref:Uncharacterized protein n=1 Tax=Ephemerocybe angulata TaxID=980116 RepID=A0A8H6HEH2_9AGAR|nr:hypothetical protein DFP72DRAFT_1051647 [Tulosesus angulatus]
MSGIDADANESERVGRSVVGGGGGGFELVEDDDDGGGGGGSGERCQNLGFGPAHLTTILRNHDESLPNPVISISPVSLAQQPWNSEPNSLETKQRGLPSDPGREKVHTALALESRPSPVQPGREVQVQDWTGNGQGWTARVLIDIRPWEAMDGRSDGLGTAACLPGEDGWMNGLGLNSQSFVLNGWDLVGTATSYECGDFPRALAIETLKSMRHSFVGYFSSSFSGGETKGTSLHIGRSIPSLLYQVLPWPNINIREARWGRVQEKVSNIACQSVSPRNQKKTDQKSNNPTTCARLDMAVGGHDVDIRQAVGRPTSSLFDRHFDRTTVEWGSTPHRYGTGIAVTRSGSANANAFVGEMKRRGRQEAFLQSSKVGDKV